jgi:protein-S-isoprenylcysteine O-methyltransferase Ste14
MTDLNKKAFGGLLRLIVTLMIFLFVPAWSLDYWQAWMYLAVFSVSVFAISVYLMKKDPKLLERRVNAGPRAEKEKSQKIIQSFASVAFSLTIIIPALDHRFGWSVMPASVSVTGDALVAIGLLLIFFVFKENTFTSGTIQVYDDQKVISSGPYSLVRHPMYFGAIIMLLGVPIALGSWWGIITDIPISIVIVLRLFDEEKLLTKSLPGYADYRKKVRFRLLPFIW